jgi:hypothetical protein
VARAAAAAERRRRPQLEGEGAQERPGVTQAPEADLESEGGPATNVAAATAEQLRAATLPQAAAAVLAAGGKAAVGRRPRLGLDVRCVEFHSRAPWDLYAHTTLLDFAAFIYCAFFYQVGQSSSGCCRRFPGTAVHATPRRC